ncbi:MAG TPA: imidazole glycerol phosphate synthase subunit HisH [Longimicrobiales bacterium]
MTIALFDYGAGNLHSLAKALEAAGARVRIEPDPLRVLAADALVLPGVGAFGAAAARLAPAAAEIRRALEDGFPCLGVCLGMQLLFEWSEEGDGRGLGILPGHVRRLRAGRVPHMGWNAVHPALASRPGGGEGARVPDPLLAGLGDLVAYYANSFVAEPADPGAVVAWTVYERHRFPAVVRRGRTWGVQFHPEKSGAPGLRLIRNFVAEAGR